MNNYLLSNENFSHLSMHTLKKPVEIISLPRNLNIKTLKGVFKKIIDNAKLNREITIDLSSVDFIDTCGVTGLASILKGFNDKGIDFYFSGLDSKNDAVKYMHDCGFISSITNYGNILPPRNSTLIPFIEIKETNHVGYIHFSLKNWILREISLSDESIDILCACISEAFQNVEHHAGGTGFGIAQIYRKKKELHISVSDHGIGIPQQVRSISPGISEIDALKKSCERGFTTKKNYQNRGFGLDNLIQYAVGGNGGTVMIRSHGATLIAKPGSSRKNTFISTNLEQWSYPGTIVHVCLRTDTLEKSEDSKPQVFQW